MIFYDDSDDMFIKCPTCGYSSALSIEIQKWGCCLICLLPFLVEAEQDVKAVGVAYQLP